MAANIASASVNLASSVMSQGRKEQQSGSASSESKGEESSSKLRTEKVVSQMTNLAITVASAPVNFAVAAITPTKKAKECSDENSKNDKPEDSDEEVKSDDTDDDAEDDLQAPPVVIQTGTLETQISQNSRSSIEMESAREASSDCPTLSDDEEEHEPDAGKTKSGTFMKKPKKVLSKMKNAAVGIASVPSNIVSNVSRKENRLPTVQELNNEETHHSFMTPGQVASKMKNMAVNLASGKLSTSSKKEISDSSMVRPGMTSNTGVLVPSTTSLMSELSMRSVGMGSGTGSSAVSLLSSPTHKSRGLLISSVDTPPNFSLTSTSNWRSTKMDESGGEVSLLSIPSLWSDGTSSPTLMSMPSLTTIGHQDSVLSSRSLVSMPSLATIQHQDSVMTMDYPAVLNSSNESSFTLGGSTDTLDVPILRDGFAETTYRRDFPINEDAAAFAGTRLDELAAPIVLSTIEPEKQKLRWAAATETAPVAKKAFNVNVSSDSSATSDFQESAPLDGRRRDYSTEIEPLEMADQIKDVAPMAVRRRGSVQQTVDSSAADTAPVMVQRRISVQKINALPTLSEGPLSEGPNDTAPVPVQRIPSAASLGDP
jgi:hypothetical protein